MRKIEINDGSIPDKLAKFLRLDKIKELRTA